MAVGERGSTKWAKAHEVEPKELEELARLAEAEGELFYWLTHGIPDVTGVVGSVRIGQANAGGFIERLYAFESLRLRLIVHPIGVPQVDGLLVDFEHG